MRNQAEALAFLVHQTLSARHVAAKRIKLKSKIANFITESKIRSRFQHRESALLPIYIESQRLETQNLPPIQISFCPLEFEKVLH